MTLSGLYQKFENLNESFNDEKISYNVISISKGNNHKLGCTKEGYPIFFIECADSPNAANIKLKMIDVLFNQKCNLILKDIIIEDKDYCLVKLNNSQEDLVKYFLDVICLVLENLPSKPTIKCLTIELAKIIRLFTNLPSGSADSIQGLWAELLVIEQSFNPDYLIKSWHVLKTDTHDFNDGENKLEVKSTCKNTRSHEFALEQLNPNPNSQLIIASVQLTKTDMGCTLFDLEKKILNRIADNECVIKLKNMILSTIGADLPTVKKIHFDYNQAKDSLVFFNYKDIPSIPVQAIPQCVSKVHFTIDLSGIKSILQCEVESPLYRSLGL